MPRPSWSARIVIVVLVFSWKASIAALPETIDHVKPSVVAVGLLSQTNSPPFAFRGTGFVVGGGNLVATNAHVIPDVVNADGMTKLVVRASGQQSATQFRVASLVGLDREHDIAVLRLEGASLPGLSLQTTDGVKEGQSVAFTGFPIGGALGFSPVTHRGSISAITPIVLPSANSLQLNEKSIRRIREGGFDILQLDATAYPGSSGSPVFDPENGSVLGIINMVFVKATKESVLSQPSGITYAIPIRFLRDLLQTIR